MKRKVIQIAESTVLVSIPSKFAKKFNLKKGDIVDVEEDDEKIIITTDNKQQNKLKTISMNITNLKDRTIKYALSALHKAGYDEITLIHEKPKFHNVIQDMIKSVLLGFVVIEQTSTKTVLKNVSNEIETEFNPALRRSFLVTLSFANSTLEMITKKEYQNLKSLIDLENSVNQLTSFGIRLIVKGLYKGEKTFMATIIWNLEKIADEYWGICINLADSKKEISPEILKLFNEVNNFLNSYYDLIYNFSLLKVNILTEVRDKLLMKLSNVNPKTREENIVISRLTTITSKISDSSSSIFAINQDKLIEEV